MQLWQRLDTEGKLHYSLMPENMHIKSEESKQTSSSATATLPFIKVEKNEEQTNTQKPQNSEMNQYMGSLVHLCEVAISCFSCDKCPMKFPLETMLNRHKLSHDLKSWMRRKEKHLRRLKSNLKKQKPTKRLEKHDIVCGFCKFSCNRRTTLAGHLKTKHKLEEAKSDTKKFECKTYPAPNQRQNPDKHIWDHKTENPCFTCDSCDFECKRSSALASHIARNHRKSDENTEVFSRKRLKTETADCEANDTQDHLTESPVIKEDIEQLYNCIDCGFQCKKRSAMTSHISKKHTNKKENEETCNLCDFKCTKKSTLYSHKRRHREENKVYTCNECGFKTGKKSSFYSHFKRKHKLPKTCTGDEQQPELFYCSQCDYKNKNKYELKVHVARKHTDDFKFSCETCGKKFKVKGDLTNHIRFSHKEQPVICDVCGKTCPNSNSLYVHQKFAHYKAKYECQVCKRRMVSQENLNEHMLRQHERRENVVCEECGKTFSRNSGLKVHMKTHTGDKPYSCTICSKSFARRTGLKQHLLIHTGIRPYVCDICGKAFTQKPGLISHRKSHPGSHPPLPRVLIDHILNDVMNN